jgi:aldose 1-epimerase
MLKNLRRWVAGLTLVTISFAPSMHAADPKITSQPFGQTKDGTPVSIYTLRNGNGCEARITNYGGILVSLTMPDRHGKMGDVVLGFAALDGYLSPAYAASNPYFGALIGRYANRIDKGRFPLDGHEYQVSLNNHGNSLHGGVVGFNQRVWAAHEVSRPDGPALELRYVSPDGEEGFPGTVTVTAVYTLTDRNTFETEFTATTDKDTVVNLTQHSYFNLKGAGEGDILDHRLMIPAAKYTPIDAKSIPLGDLAPVPGTPFDFNQMTPIGARIGADDQQLKNGKGYDHNFVVAGWQPGGAIRLMARVEEPTTGRVLEVSSNAPGVQFYSGNFLDGTLTGKGGQVYQQHAGLALEPGDYPDTPNHPQWPTAELKKGETYHHTIIWKFSVQP